MWSSAGSSRGGVGAALFCCLVCSWNPFFYAADPICPVEWVDAEDVLFLLYTSGSTGRPKGVVHTHGGYMLWAAMTNKYTFDLHPDDVRAMRRGGSRAASAGGGARTCRRPAWPPPLLTHAAPAFTSHPQVYWCTADIGWITGHSYITYGPLCNGATSIMFEGIPTFPEADRFWQVVAKYKVNAFYTGASVRWVGMRRWQRVRPRVLLFFRSFAVSCFLGCAGALSLVLACASFSICSFLLGFFYSLFFFTLLSLCDATSHNHPAVVPCPAPTAIRALMRYGDDFPKKHDLSSLRVLGTVGEPINPEAWLWYYEGGCNTRLHRSAPPLSPMLLPGGDKAGLTPSPSPAVVGNKRCSVVDTWWQTETGGHMLTPLPGATPTKPGSAVRGRKKRAFFSLCAVALGSPFRSLQFLPLPRRCRCSALCRRLSTRTARRLRYAGRRPCPCSLLPPSSCALTQQTAHHVLFVRARIPLRVSSVSLLFRAQARATLSSKSPGQDKCAQCTATTTGLR